MSFIEKLSRPQIIAVRVVVAVVSVLVGVLLIAHNGNNDTLLGLGALAATFGPMLAWVIGEPNPNKRRKPTR